MDFDQTSKFTDNIKPKLNPNEGLLHIKDKKIDHRAVDRKIELKPEMKEEPLDIKEEPLDVKGEPIEINKEPLDNKEEIDYQLQTRVGVFVILDGKKLYKCKICEKDFGQQKTLKNGTF